MIVLYSTGCPICEIMKKKLIEKNISFTVNSDINSMLELGITAVPVLEVEGQLLKTKEAMEWINNVV